MINCNIQPYSKTKLTYIIDLYERLHEDNKTGYWAYTILIKQKKTVEYINLYSSMDKVVFSRLSRNPTL